MFSAQITQQTALLRRSFIPQAKLLSTAARKDSLSKPQSPAKNHEDENPRPADTNKIKLYGIALTTLLGSYGLKKWLDSGCDGKADFTLSAKEVPKDVGKFIDGLPVYKRTEIQKHDSTEKRVWVTFGRGVYDITELIPKHPGGKDQIQMAAGGALEPFWNIYAVHKDNPHVYGWMETFRIGNLCEEDTEDESKDLSDPFAGEPLRHPALRVKSQKPFNAEPPMSLLTESFFTPNDLFYVRTHLPVPDIKAVEYELEIQGLGGKPVTCNLNDLMKFKQVSVISALQCGGNRRVDMNVVKPVKGLGWDGAAIGNAKWTGVLLKDVLEHVGALNPKDMDAQKELHVQFEGYDVGADGKPFEASVPLEMAMRNGAILAFEMNGEKLSRDHGYPVRMVVPGSVAVRNVKWLSRICLAEEESNSHWQKNDYKGFNPSVTWDNVDYTKSPAILSTPVTSAICKPGKGSSVKPGKVQLAGYAYSGGGNRIIRVDVSIDKGENWFEAKLTEQDVVKEPRHFGWTLWKAEIEVSKNQKEVEVWTKAVDSSYNVQPEEFKNIWNIRGQLSNAYCKRKYNVE